MGRDLGDVFDHFIPGSEKPDPAGAATLGHEALIRGLREKLDNLGLSLRVVAEGMLGADSPIDLVTVDPGGGVKLIFVSSQGEDPALVGHALAQRDWVSPRLRDWLKLSPDLGIRPERGVGLLLLAPSFSSGVIAAAQATEPDAVMLASYRRLRGGGLELDTPTGMPSGLSPATGPRHAARHPSRS